MPRIALAFLCSLLVLAAAAVRPPASIAADKAPSFELETLQGDDLSLRELTTGGRHLLLVFWTTWCPSCRQTMPEVDQLASDYSRDDLSVLGINAGWNDSRSRAATFRDEHELGYPIAFDKNSRIARNYGIRGVPTLFLIGPGKNILYQGYSVNIRLLQLLENMASE
jgi:peroxiredoxin